MVNCHKCGKPIKVTRDIHYDMMDGNKVIGKICKRCAKKENPNRPTKEYWGKVYPAVLKSMKKYGWKKGSKYKTIEQAAAAVTASMWHDKLKPGTKAFYERIRRIREGKARKKNWSSRKKQGRSFSLVCPGCKTTFEAEAKTVGLPPFDVECPNCGELVGSEHAQENPRSNAEVDIGAKGMGVHVKTGKEDTAGLKATLAKSLAFNELFFL